MHLHPWSALDAAARAAPHAEALVFPHQSARMTFCGWRDEAARLAGAFSSLGLEAGDHIALLAENRVEWPVVQMACAALGAVFVPLNTHYRKDDLAYALKQSDAKAVIAATQFRGNPYLENIAALRPVLKKLKHVISLEADYPALLRSARVWTPGDLDPDAVASLLYTSGTTGFPKGALLTHRAMMMVAEATGGRLGLRAGDRWTSIIPLFHCAGCILGVLGCAQFGAAYVGVPNFDPVVMFDVIEKERCTFLSGVPTSFLAMLDHPRRAEFDLTSLRAGTCGGADCNAEVLKRCAGEFPVPGLAQVYGQTEGATLFVCPEHDDPLRFETAGRALPGYELRIADPLSLEPKATGEIGEIQARGVMRMEGYYGMPAETAETVLPDGWLRTGDLGLLREDGRLVIAGGRLRDMIIRGGENIYPAEIENLLQQHPAVAAIAVFGEKDVFYGETVSAAVKLRNAVAAQDLHAYCAARIAKFKAPACFYQVDGFPLTPSGKVRKVELRQRAARGELERLA